MSYRALLHLTLEHGYQHAPFLAFDVLLPRDSQALLKRGRVLLRRTSTGISLFAEHGVGNAPAVNLAGQRLRLLLAATDPSFAAITELPFGLGSEWGLYRAQNGQTTLADPIAVRPVGSVVRHRLSLPQRPVTVRLRDADNHLLTSQVVLDAEQSEISFDLSASAPGAIRLHEDAGGLPNTSTVYLEPELRSSAVFAAVEIDLSSSYYDAAPEFVLPLAARREVLKYYCVVRGFNPLETSGFAVHDAGGHGIGFARSLLFAPDDLPATTLGEDTSTNTQVLLFKSLLPVARQALPRRRIQLRRNGEVLLQDLPSPNPTSPHADLVIHLSK